MKTKNYQSIYKIFPEDFLLNPVRLISLQPMRYHTVAFFSAIARNAYLSLCRAYSNYFSRMCTVTSFM